MAGRHAVRVLYEFESHSSYIMAKNIETLSYNGALILVCGYSGSGTFARVKQELLVQQQQCKALSSSYSTTSQTWRATAAEFWRAPISCTNSLLGYGKNHVGVCQGQVFDRCAAIDGNARPVCGFLE